MHRLRFANIKLLLFVHTKTFLNLSTRPPVFYEFLSTGEEWMTLGTNFNADVLFW